MNGEGELPDQPSRNASAAEIDAFLEAVLFHYILRCEEGQPPDPDSYLTKYPQYAEELATMISGGVDAPFVPDTPGTATRERRRGWSLKKIGDYDIQFLATSTGSSHVYKAKRPGDEKSVALKVHRRAQHVDQSEVERFRREARILGDLDFPGVVPLIDVGEEEGSLYVAMPWIEGITVLEAIDVLRGDRPKGQFDVHHHTPESKAKVILQVARSLIEVHARGILHRDLKPSNIMLNGQNQAILIDFGIARREGDSGLTLTGDQVQGTPRYLAPEILNGDALSTTERGEVYALGLTLYEFLLERPAYDCDSRKTLFAAILAGTPPPPSEVDPRIRPALSRVVMKAITHNPMNRFADMGAFATALEKVIEQTGRMDRVPMPRVVSIIVGLTILIIIAVIIYLN